MSSQKNNKFRDGKGFWAGIIVLVLGSLYVIVMDQIGFYEPAVIVTLLLAAILIYGVLSKRIYEIGGPGWRMRFHDIAASQVDPSLDEVALIINQPEIVYADNFKYLYDINISRAGKPVVLTIAMGVETDYSPSLLNHILDNLASYPTFYFVAVVDHEKRVVAHTNPWLLRQYMMRSDVKDSRVINDIFEGQEDKVIEHDVWIDASISVSSSNSEALRKMDKRNQDALIVIDDLNRFVGIVERRKIISRLFEVVTQRDPRN